MHRIYVCKDGNSEVWECNQEHWYKVKKSLECPSGYKVRQNERYLVRS